MLEVVMPGIRYGQGKINSSTAYRGTLCFIAGVDADGYQLLQVPYTTAQSAKSFYPINKLRMQEDLSDTAPAVELLAKGDTIVYYGGGEYITDRFNKNSIGLTAQYWSVVEGGLTSVWGRKLYNPGSSTAIGTTGLDKLYVGTAGTGSNGPGYLWGTTAFSRGTMPGDNYIGFSIGVNYTDSTDAKLRFRILPARYTSELNF